MPLRILLRCLWQLQTSHNYNKTSKIALICQPTAAGMSHGAGWYTVDCAYAVQHACKLAG